MQQIANTIFLAYNSLPRIHRIMLGSLTAATFAVTIWRPFIYHSKHESSIKNIELESRQLRAMQPEASEPIDEDLPIPDDEFPQGASDQEEDKEEKIHEYIVSSGDTLGNILIQHEIETSDVTLLAAQHPDLCNLKIGQQLSWVQNMGGALQQLKWEVSRREIRTYDRNSSGFRLSQQWRQDEQNSRVINGRLNGSFISSAIDAGLRRTEIGAVIRALQWQLDFKKLRKGDLFSILISREHFDSKKIHSQLLAVRIHTSGKDYYAIRAEDHKFYDHKGSSVDGGFMRLPTMKQFRVSSNFNLNRVNPVTGRIAPHKGVDFAMPIGTPVVAVSDGEVLIAKHSGSAGYYMAIRHGSQYTTRYMHLQRLLLKPGQKIKCGERIGLSGNSGRSTGPHLHFELWINQKAVNPMTAKLPCSKNLIGRSRVAYLDQIRGVIARLQLD